MTTRDRIEVVIVAIAASVAVGILIHLVSMKHQ